MKSKSKKRAKSANKKSAKQTPATPEQAQALLPIQFDERPKISDALRAKIIRLDTATRQTQNKLDVPGGPHEMLRNLLAENKLTFDDVLRIRAEADEMKMAISAAMKQAREAEEQAKAEEEANRPPPQPPSVNVYDAVLKLVQRHIDTTPERACALTLWILHTWVFDRYFYSPRLMLLSPTPACGKSEVLKLCFRLCSSPLKTDRITGPAIYRAVETFRNRGEKPTLLLDEADLIDPKNTILKNVLNSGFSADGSTTIVENKVAYQFGPTRRSRSRAFAATSHRH